MKKILLLFLVLSWTSAQAAFCNPQSSSNAFEIPIDNIPPGGRSGGSGGLSSGAVTAITLGSVFGGAAALGGLGWYFAHKTGLTCGYACGCNSPYTTVLIDDYSILTKLKLNQEQNKYLIKAFEYITPEKNSSKKYLLIQDLNIKSKTYNTIFFDLPDTKVMTRVKIIQVSEPFIITDKLPALDTKITVNPKSKTAFEIPTTVVKNDYQNGVLIKEGNLKNFESKAAAIVTENKMHNAKNYALIIEFSN